MILSIIVPVYNEERLVGELLGRVADVEFEDGIIPEIIVVNDGSSDGTSDSVRKFIEAHPNLNLVSLDHEINRGKGAAVRSGMKAATGDVLIVQDADLEYDPEEIKDVIAPILSGDFKVVYGSRILREKEMGRSGVLGMITGKHPHSYVLAYLGGVAITQWTNLLTGANLTDEPTCYKCFHRSALEGVEIESDDFAWEPEVTVKLLRSGLTIHEVPISYHPRKMSEGKKIHWQDGVQALWTVWKYH